MGKGRIIGVRKSLPCKNPRKNQWTTKRNNWKTKRRLKKNIKHVGSSPRGIKIYTFEYIDDRLGKGTYQGVMSDEIPQDAVIEHPSGFDTVDYSKLDVEFKNLI